MIKKVCSDIRLAKLYLSIPDFTAIGYIIASISDIPFNLALLDCNIDMEAVNALLAELKYDKVEQLSLTGLDIGLVSSTDMQCIRKLLSRLPSLKTLSVKASNKVRGSNVDKDYCIQLPNVTKFSVISIEINQLYPLNNLSFSKLTELNLRGSIGRSFYIDQLADGLHDCLQLEMLDISANSIEETDAHILSSSLKCCKNLKRFNIRDNKISKLGIIAIIKSLELLGHLKLNSYDITENEFNDIDLPILLKPITGLQLLGMGLNYEASISLLSSSKCCKSSKN